MNKEMEKIKVLLVDDHAVVRAGYEMLLKNSTDIEVLVQAESGEQAIKAYIEHQPDVIVMDLSLPGIGGLEAIRRIIARDSTARILVFSMHDDTIFVEQALQAGAKGYIPKSSSPDALADGIRAIYKGETYVDANIAERIASSKVRGENTPFSNLSTREFEIFCLLAKGLNTSEIAKCLSISYKTVANYSTQIKNKLDVSTVAELARMAIRYKIIDA